MRKNHVPLGVAAFVACATLTTVLFGDNPPDNPDRDSRNADRSTPGPAGSDGQQGTSGQGMNGQQGMNDRNMGDRSEMGMYQSFASDPRTIPDKLFVWDTWMGSQWEIAYSDLIINKVDDQQVKDLAKQIRDDHKQTIEKLRPIAQKLNVPVNEGLPQMKQARLDLLRKLPNDQLVKCYLADQRAMHAKDITCFSDVSSLAMNDQIKNFARETLPTLREHGDHIVEVASNKGITGDFVTAGGGSMNEPVEGNGR